MSPSLLLVHAKADSGICKRAFNGCKLPFESTLFQRIMVTNIMRHATLFFTFRAFSQSSTHGCLESQLKTLDLVSCYELKR